MTGVQTCALPIYADLTIAYDDGFSDGVQNKAEEHSIIVGQLNDDIAVLEEESAELSDAVVVLNQDIDRKSVV